MLKLVNAGAATSRRPKHLSSPQQARTKAVLATISRAWQTLSPEQRENWNALGQVWSAGKKSTSTGFAVFQALNNVRIQTTGDNTLLTDAPQKPDMIQELPPLTVAARYSAPAAFQFSIASTAYEGLIRVAATPPLSPGVTRLRGDEFRNICTLGELLPTTFITSDYLARFPAPVAGMQVGVTLTPVSVNGFLGQPITSLVVVAAPAEAGLTLQK